MGHTSTASRSVHPLLDAPSTRRGGIPSSLSAHLNSLEAASKALGAGVAAAAAEVEATNRKRKAEQTEAGPRLMRLEAEWVQGVKKNLEIESQCLRLEHEVAAMRSAR